MEPKMSYTRYPAAGATNRSDDMAGTYPVNEPDSLARLQAGRVLATSIPQDAAAFAARIAAEAPALQYRSWAEHAGPGTTFWTLFEKLHADDCTCATCDDARAMGL